MKTMQTLCGALLGVAVMTAGCSQKSDSKPATNGSNATNDTGAVPAHTHGQGPNGGVVFDLGAYHAEFTVDHNKSECMVVIIGGDEKTPAAVAVNELTLATKETKTKDGTVVPAITITLKPKDAADGKASKFVGTDPGLGNVADFEGTVIAEIDGKPSQGEFKE